MFIPILGEMIPIWRSFFSDGWFKVATNQKSWYEQIGMLDVGIPIIDVNIDEWKGWKLSSLYFYISTRAGSWFLRRVEITYHNWCFLRVRWRGVVCPKNKNLLKKKLANQKVNWSNEKTHWCRCLFFFILPTVQSAVFVVFKSLR